MVLQRPIGFLVGLSLLLLPTASGAWHDETHLAVAKAAGYAKWFNATGADMAKLKAGPLEQHNHYVNNPLDTMVTPEVVLAQVERYNTIEAVNRRTSLTRDRHAGRPTLIGFKPLPGKLARRFETGHVWTPIRPLGGSVLHADSQYDAASDPSPIYEGQPQSPGPGGDSGDDESDEAEEYASAESSKFAYEKDLQSYLARNLHLIEPGLRLYDEEDITGIEFPAGGRFIDILALDTDDNYGVIELKVSKGYDRVVGQLLRYMGWIEKNHADDGQSVRGVIIAKDISDDLRLATSRIAGVDLFEYALSVSLAKVGA